MAFLGFRVPPSRETFAPLRARRLLLAGLVSLYLLAIFLMPYHPSDIPQKLTTAKMMHEARPQKVTEPTPLSHVVREEISTTHDEEDDSLSEDTFSVSKIDDKTGISPWVFPSSDGVWIPEPNQIHMIPAKILYPPLPTGWNPDICFVARTFVGQSPESKNRNSIDTFIASLLMQTNPHWSLYIIDTGPVREGVPHMEYLQNQIKTLTRVDPDRIHVVDIESLPQPPEKYTYAARPTSGEQQQQSNQTNLSDDQHLLHTHIYWLTDMTIRKFCPPSSKFFVATNGDNWYHPKFVESVLERDASWIKILEDNHVSPIKGPDVIGVDFYSRYFDLSINTDPLLLTTRRREGGCAAIKKSSPCIKNTNRATHTDLGANAIRISSFIDENYYFFNSSDGCSYINSHDGCFAERTRHWNKIRVDECLFSHAPNAWQCKLYGGRAVLFTNDAVERMHCFYDSPTRDQLGAAASYLNPDITSGPEWLDGNCFDSPQQTS